MLGPLLNNGSIANAQSPLLFNHQEGAQIIQANYAGHPLAVSDSSRPTAGRRRSDELSMLTAERYADLEWPVKRALTFGYTNYASPQDLSKISTDKRNHERSGRLSSLDPLDDSLETKEQLAKYYFKLFPFSPASDYHRAGGNRSSDPFDFESQDEAYIKSRKRLKANARRLSRKAKGANSSNKPANSNENFKSSRFFSKSNSIDSSSSSSSSSPQSSRRSSTDSIDNGGDAANSGGLTLEDQGNTNGLSFEELEDDDVQVEKELNDDEDFSILEELNDGERGRSGSNSPNRTKNTVLEERDLSDKQLLKSLMASGGGGQSTDAKSPTHPELTNENRKPSEFSSSNSNNQTNSNSIASLSKLSNSSESPFHNLPSSNTSSHFSRVVADHLGDASSSNGDSNAKRRSDNQMLLESLDLPSHTNELLDDSEDDDDNLDQYITTMSIIKKSRNVRHSKPLTGPADQGRNPAANGKDDFVLLPDAPGTGEYAGDGSAKKRHDLHFVERSEMLPEPAALQSSSLSNQWINSTSPPFPTSTSAIRPSASSNSTSSSSSFDPNDSTVDRSTLNAARTWKTKLFLTMKIIAISTVILLAIFGNLLVIISVLRHHKLRTLPNYFVVSLACADILVALFAMTFKASLAILGSWMFGQLVCDLYNSCDVLFSTASIMHLCCISVDRYYAIIKPLDYPILITSKLVFIMLTVVWISSTIISFIPIFTGIYTTTNYLDYQKTHPDECDFHVNPYYALISSTVSFWIPCLVMLFAYYRIFLEANRQEKMLYKSQMIIPQHHHRNKKKQTKPAPNLQPAANNRQTTEPVQQPALPAATTPSQPNANNNSNQQVNLNNNDEEVAVPPASVEPKNSIPEITNGATVGHNGARLSNTSTTTTVTTLSTSTTTTATSGPATTSSSGAQQQQTTTAQLENAGKEETSLTRRKSSSITASMSAAALPNSQSMELKNSQINLSVQEKQPAHPQKPTSIDIQPANTAPVASGAHRNSHGDDTESGQSTPTKRNINKMRREHKAAKTLGIVMGVFFVCWLPFFTVYVVLAICGKSCDSFPGVVVDFLFWIGYFNSSLNPIIYAYFNREFREAFKKTIQDVFCCCWYKVECMRNIRYQLAGQNPDRLNNNGLGVGPNAYARRNTTASYTGQFSTSGALGPSGNAQLLSNSNLSMNSSSLMKPVSNPSAGKA